MSSTRLFIGKMSCNFVIFVTLGVALLVARAYANPPPPRCGPNERRGNCGRICEEKCGTSGMEECARTSCAGEGCQCLPGFSRDKDSDKCVRPFECPKPKCQANEVLGDCGRACEGNCENSSRPERCKTMKCPTQGCQCDRSRGYIRDLATGNCTRNQDDKKCAAKLKCPCNSKPQLCGGVCQPTCSRPAEIACEFLTKNCVIGCQCLEGYVKNEITGECVKRNRCPR